MLEAIVAADGARVVALLDGLPEAERRALAPNLLRLAKALQRGGMDTLGIGSDGESFIVEWGDREAWQRAVQQEQTLHAALLGTATWRELRPLRELVSVRNEHAFEVLAKRQPSWIADWFEHVSRQDPVYRWSLARKLVHAGLIDRPSLYLPGLLRQQAPGLLARDPALLEQDVWDLLAYHGEDSLRAADDNGAAAWGEALAERAADGQLSRERLLDVTLDALAGDLDAYRAGWFTRFWRTLAATPEEAAHRADRLVAALGAAAAPVVAFAVTELLRAGVTVPAPDLAPALAAVSKTTVLKALRLLDRAPDAEVGLIALGHASADVQAATLDRIERWGAPAGLHDQLGLLAATQRPRAEALLGVKVEAPPTAVVEIDSIPEAIRTALNFGGPLPRAPVPGEPVLGAPAPAPIASLEELAGSLAAALVNPEAFSDRERLLDGILRHCDDRTAFHDVLLPYTKDLPHFTWQASELAVAEAWRSGTANLRSHEPGLWERRILAAERRAAAGDAAPLLALPTHAGGWVEPGTLVERVRAVGERADPDELAQALLRLAPEGRARALSAAADLPGRPGAALRCALGGAPVPPARVDEIAARAVHLPPLDPVPAARVVPWDVEDYPYHHPDHTVYVDGHSVPEPLGEAAARAAGHHFRESPYDWPARRDLFCAGWFARGYGDLAPLLLPLVRAREPLPPLCLRLALNALGAEPTDRLMAVDVLIAAIDDGRADAHGMIGYLRDDLPSLLTNRVTPALTEIAAAGPLHAVVVRDVLGACIDVVTKRPGPLRKLLEELQAQTEDADAEALLLAARVRRAQRWIG